MKTNWIRTIVMLAALALPTLVHAHEGHIHKVLGTVTRIDGVHVSIKTTDGKTVVVMVDPKTTVTRGKETLDVHAIQVGQRISVDAMEEKEMMMAHAVKLATTSPAAKK